MPGLLLPLFLATTLAPGQDESAPPAPPATDDAPAAPDDVQSPGEPTTSQPGDSTADTPAASDPGATEPGATEPGATDSDRAEPGPAEGDTTGAGDSSVARGDANGCPCGPTDWACMQENPVACDWAGRRPPPPTDDGQVAEPSQIEADSERPPDKKRMEPRRTGLLVGIGGGYLGCRTAYCQDVFRGAFAMEAELGYRWRFIAPVIIVAGGRGPLNLPPEFADLKARLGFVDVGVGAVAFPAPRSIFDPYFGVTLGMQRSRINVRERSGGDASVDETATRGAVRFAAGLNFFLAPRVSLGPRFAINVPFAGKWCLIGQPDPMNQNRCRQVRDLRAEEALDPRDLPRSFAFTVHLRLILPPHGAEARPRKPRRDSNGARRPRGTGTARTGRPGVPVG